MNMSFADDAARSAYYHERGYLIVENLLSKEHIRSLRVRIQDIADGRAPDYPPVDIEFEPRHGDEQPRVVRKINRCAENDPLFLSHAKNEQILDIVESLIGPDIKLFGSQCFMKPPGGVEKPYHQDSAYFTVEPMDLVTCWTALDDVTLDNGCMWVIPGSHRQGLVDHSQPWQLDGRVDKQVPDALIESDLETPIIMPAGSCSFHHSLVLHRSRPNHSDRPRRGLAVHYMSSQTRWTHPDDPQPAYPLLRGREFPGCV